MSADRRLSARAVLGAAVAELIRPPQAVLLAVLVLAYVASVSGGTRPDDLSVLVALLLAVASTYVRIAMTLAAAAPRRLSADHWLLEALRRGVFWRLALAQLAQVLLVALGALAAGIGAFVAGAWVALAQAVAVLERAWPATALRRSAELGRGSRVALGVVFGGLYVVPLAAAQGLTLVRPEALWLGVAGLATVLLEALATVALTRAYVALGGTPTPVAAELTGDPQNPAAR